MGLMYWIKFELLGLPKPRSHLEMVEWAGIENAKFHLEMIMQGKSTWNFDYYCVLSAIGVDSKDINRILSKRNKSDEAKK